MRLAVLEDRAPDRDRRVEVAVVAEIAHRATIQAAPLTLRRGDQLHRADLGRAGQRARWEHGAQRVERVQLRPQLRLHVAHEVEDVAVALDLHVLAGGHGAGPRDAPEVVAAEVHEHHVLGALLGVTAELVGHAVVVGRRGAPRPGAGDRVRRHRSPTTWSRSSGLAPTTSNDGVRVKNRYGDGLTRRSARYRPMPSMGVRRRRWGGRTTGAGRGRPGSPRRPRSRPSRARPPGCTRRGRATCPPRGTRSRSRRRRSSWTARRPPPSRPGLAAPSARGPRRSPPRRSGSGRRGRAPRCAVRRSPTGCG